MPALPRLQTDIELVEESRKPTLAFQQFWDNTVRLLEETAATALELVTRIIAVEEDIVSIETNIDEIEANIDEIEANIDEIETNIDEIETIYVPAYRVWRQFYLSNL